MQVCVVTFKECWRDDSGRWHSSGGFPQQMAALGDLFHGMTLVVVGIPAREGGSPLPEKARVVPMPRPVGEDARRKLSVMLRLPGYVRAMLPHIRAADVVHIPLPGDLSLVGLVVALTLRKRVVARFAGSWASTSETTPMDRLTRAGLRLLAGGRRVMLATGIGSSPPAPKMSWVVATSISRRDVDLVRPDCDRPARRPLHLVYAGRFAPEKGVEDLIDAIALLRENGQAVPSLTLYGDGPLRESLTDRVRRHRCEDLVHFAGQLGRPELLRALLQADLCVLPSLSESFCKARLDAMLCGVPVVTTPVGFGREIVGKEGERGWIVSARDSRGLAERLASLREGVDWPELRRRCRAFAEAWTVEDWALTIAGHCARQWDLTLIGGKLCA